MKRYAKVAWVEKAACPGPPKKIWNTHNVLRKAKTILPVIMVVIFAERVLRVIRVMGY